MNLEDMTLDVEQHIDIKAPPEKAFAAVLERVANGDELRPFCIASARGTLGPTANRCNWIWK